MGLLNFVSKQPIRIKNNGFKNTISNNLGEITRYYLRKFEQYDNRGKEIYNEMWDVLVILDGCRVDALEEVADEYRFLPTEIQSIRSLASMSEPWMKRNFTQDTIPEMMKTSYITGNPYSEEQLNKRDFLLLDQVWQYNWDSDIGTVPARAVTDRAISTARDHDPDRIIVHYMQPHFPSIPSPIGSGITINTFGKEWDSVWDQLRKGEIDVNTVWNSYIDNLRYVLDDVKLLLNNLDRNTIVISADHGNAFGEWWQYGHPKGVPIQPIRTVPWVVTTGRDTGEYQPSSMSRKDQINNIEIRSRLEDLGYM